MFQKTLPHKARQLLTELGQEPLVQPSYLAGGNMKKLYQG